MITLYQKWIFLKKTKIINELYYCKRWEPLKLMLASSANVESLTKKIAMPNTKIVTRRISICKTKIVKQPAQQPDVVGVNYTERSITKPVAPQKPNPINEPDNKRLKIIQ